LIATDCSFLGISQRTHELEGKRPRKVSPLLGRCLLVHEKGSTGSLLPSLALTSLGTGIPAVSIRTVPTVISVAGATIGTVVAILGATIGTVVAILVLRRTAAFAVAR